MNTVTFIEMYYSKKFLEVLGRPTSAGETITFQVFDEIGKESQATKLEEKMLLPKDLLNELEKMDEERMNEHLKTRESIQQVPSDDRSAFVQSLQNQQNSLMNRRLSENQQMFASAQSLHSGAWPGLMPFPNR